MTAPVDVLAVMDCAAETFVRMKGAAANPQLVNCQRDAVVEARAAVAELIEACESLEKYPDDLEIQAQFVRALARVKGA